MTKITDTIKPFVTKLKLPSTLTPKEHATISISQDNATIYKDEDSGHEITVPIWGFNGQYPGPTIETERDKTITINWVNNIKEDERNPCKADIVTFEGNANESIPQNILEASSQDPLIIGDASNGAEGKGFVVTHLHGGKVPPNYDGWPESMLLPKKDGEEPQSRLCRYENKQRAMTLWYHDHAMHTTRLNAYAGLAGLWVIRDEEEKSLCLPSEEFEVPLVIQDKNLTDINDFSSNRDNARLLHRVEKDGPLEFFGPLTLVNGAIWPKHKVKSQVYRLRLLNASNARFYRLRFAELADDGSYNWCDTIQVKQIGTDCGLMQQPVDLPNNGLVIAPAERADLIVDFSSVKGKKIVLLNTAEAPFANSAPLPLADLFPADPATHTIDGEAWRTPYPQVMMFDVDVNNSTAFDFAALALNMNEKVNSFANEDPIPHLPQVPEQIVRTGALVEKTVEMKDKEGKIKKQVILVQWELSKKSAVGETMLPILTAQREVTIDGEEFVVTAERFQDPVNWVIKHGSTEKWRFINLTEDTHPMHVHLVQFRSVARKNIKVEGVIGDTSVVDFVNDKSLNNETIVINEDTANPASLDENEEFGYKDTLRVNPGEMVELVATFEGYCGRYVYHCHLLEHEDHDMMRQFIVTRDDMDGGEYGLPISVGLDNMLPLNGMKSASGMK
ncbi:MAG: multicopper oxidase family protein [Thiohalomonadales bacterium]